VILLGWNYSDNSQSAKEIEGFKYEFNNKLNQLETKLDPDQIISPEEVHKLLKDLETKYGIDKALKEEIHNSLKTLQAAIHSKDQSFSEQVELISQKIDKLEQTTDISPHIQSYITSQLLIFNADKTAKVDYALGSTGGKVISVQVEKKPTSSWNTLERDQLRISENLLDPSVDLGNCWSFLGHNANVTIKLKCSIRISQISIEHPDPRILSQVNSAPHKFQFYGTRVDRINIHHNMNHTLLIQGLYNIPGALIQEYTIESTEIWSYVTLAILSNHNPVPDDKDYTCVYRLRVHSTEQSTGGVSIS